MREVGPTRLGSAHAGRKGGFAGRAQEEMEAGLRPGCCPSLFLKKHFTLFSLLKPMQKQFYNSDKSEFKSLAHLRNKAMHQHECTKNVDPMMKLNYLLNKINHEKCKASIINVKKINHIKFIVNC